MSEATQIAEVETSPQSKGSLQSVPLTTKIGALTLSREFDEIIPALGAIQSAINEGGVTADTRNAELQNLYAPLPVILKALAPYLKEQKVTLLQPYETDGETVRVTTIFIKGTQYASMTASMTSESRYPQAIGSAVTYCCRYSVRSILGLAVDGPGDQDDDGNSASGVKHKDRPILASTSEGKVEVSTSHADEPSTDPVKYSEALRGYLKRVDAAEKAGLVSAKSQVSSFKLIASEEKILLKAIDDRLAKLEETSS